MKEVLVSVGAEVKKGDVLFLIEDSDAAIKLMKAEASHKQRSAELQNVKDKLQIVDNIKDDRAISKDERNQRQRAVEIAEALLESSQAEMAASQNQLTLHSVRSTINGTIMAMNLRAGEYAPATHSGDALIQLGNLKPLHIRVDIDENDAWRVLLGSNATAFLRGNPEITVPLQFVRLEPFVRPKRSLTGGSAERVDTRVLQVIYRFDPNGRPIYAGQQMDVYIEAAPTVAKQNIGGSRATE